MHMHGSKWAGLEVYDLGGPRKKAKGVCLICQTEFFFNPYQSFGKFCSRKCSSIHQKSRTGSLSHKWKGGSIYNYGPSWQQAQLNARYRDKVCQNCGITPADNGMELDVHHIKPFRDFGIDKHIEANSLDNLICYCRSCHISTEQNTNGLPKRANKPKTPKRKTTSRPTKPTPKRDAIPCPVCGNIFISKHSWPTKHCSRECYNKTRRQKVETNCPVCDKKFSYHQSWPRKYCSRKCNGIANIGNVHKNK